MGFVGLLTLIGRSIFEGCKKVEQARTLRKILAESEQRRQAMEREEKRLEVERERMLRALQLADVDNMEGLAFEHYVCRLLVHQGFVANVTPASNDFGVDIVAERNGRKLAIQVKCYCTAVPRNAISDAVAGKLHYGCDHAMVVTNNYFTRGAKELAYSTDCQLIDRDLFARWILDFQQDTSDIVAPHVEPISQPLAAVVESRETILAGNGKMVLVAGVGLFVFLLCSWGFTNLSATSAEARPTLDMKVITSVRTVETSPPSNQNNGSINHTLIGTLKDAWRCGGWRYKSKEDQAKGMALMASCVEAQCPNPANRKATRDYIERTIAAW